MDILKRSIAPISAEAWEEIDSTAKDVITSILSARLGLSLNGPKGWDYTAVPDGRLDILENQKDGVTAGTFILHKLVEARIPFTLDKWELDNIERGAKDLNLDNLEEAAEKLAYFEDDVIFNGFNKAGIVGLAKAAEHQLSFGKEPNEMLKSIGEAKYALFNSYVKPPFNLFVSAESYERINVIYEGAHLLRLIERIIEGKVIRSKAVDGAIMIPHKDDDLELTIGQDFSIGYEWHDTSVVKLFITESLFFRVLDAGKIVHFSL